MKIKSTALVDVLIIEPAVFSDIRGEFFEIYHRTRFRGKGLGSDFVQDNLSVSKKGVLRGLHYQVKHPQAKLIQVIAGEVFDVAVDLRLQSNTFGKWAGAILSDQNRYQLYIPEGFAHGFCVLSETAHVVYKCSDYYHPEDEGGIIWSDARINIDWPIRKPVVSEKDRGLPQLKDLTPDHLPGLKETA